MNTVLKFENVTYWYDKNTVILKSLNAEFEKGKFYSIIGPSGSGKSTLLSLASGLDSCKEGAVYLGDKNVNDIGLGNYRKNHISIIFQNFNLLPYMTAVQNLTSAMRIKNIKGGNLNEKALEMLAKVGITKDQANQNVLTLSGGQQQRVAIARALLSNNDIIIADEPTGNLDEENSDSIIELFKTIAKEEEKCIIMVTHNRDIAKKCDAIYTLKNKTLLKVYEKEKNIS